MAEQGHHCLQGHAGVDETGRVGVSELVRGHVEWLPVAAVQARCGRGVVESLAQPIGGQSAAALHEQEVGGPLQPGLWQGPLWAALRNRVRPARQRGSGRYARAHGSQQRRGCASRAG
jgi:hypothetical protein